MPVICWFLGKEKASFQIPYAFLKEAVHIAPVYYALAIMSRENEKETGGLWRGYLEFEKEVRELGVVFLEMRQESWKWRRNFNFSALPPYQYYKKRQRFSESEEIEVLLGKNIQKSVSGTSGAYPKYGDSYTGMGQ